MTFLPKCVQADAILLQIQRKDLWIISKLSSPVIFEVEIISLIFFPRKTMSSALFSPSYKHPTREEIKGLKDLLM